MRQSRHGLRSKRSKAHENGDEEFGCEHVSVCVFFCEEISCAYKDFLHRMENILFNELRMRGFQVDVGIVNKYTKDENQKTCKSTYEVDFVATRGSRKYYIQSAYRMDSPEKEDQEKFSLRNIRDSFKKLVVVRDNIRPRRDESGILTIGIRQFLLDANAMDL